VEYRLKLALLCVQLMNTRRLSIFRPDGYFQRDCVHSRRGVCAQSSGSVYTVARVKRAIRGVHLVDK